MRIATISLNLLLLGLALYIACQSYSDISRGGDNFGYLVLQAPILLGLAAIASLLPRRPYGGWDVALRVAPAVCFLLAMLIPAIGIVLCLVCFPVVALSDDPRTMPGLAHELAIFVSLSAIAFSGFILALIHVFLLAHRPRPRPAFPVTSLNHAVSPTGSAC